MQMKCEISDCELDRFENESKCVLHCDKTIYNNWIISDNTEDNNITPRNAKIWNDDKVEYFWETLFEEVKKKILNVRNSHRTTNEAVRVLGKSKKNGFILNFLHVKFPAQTKLLENYTSSNNKIINYNDFQNCTFYDNCIINMADFKASIKNSKVVTSETTETTRNFFHSTNFEHGLIINRPHSKNQRLDLFECNVADKIELSGEFEEIKIEKTKSNSLCIANFENTNIHSISLKDCNISKITMDKNQIEKLELENINLENINSHSIEINHCQFNKASFVHINTETFSMVNIDLLENSRFLLENLETKTLIIKRLSQEAKYLQFHYINVANELILDRAEFKNSYFNDFNVKNAKKVISKVSFIYAHLNSIEWGKIFEIESPKDMFRQLKFVNDKQGNYIEANNFYVAEMEAHKKETLNNKPWFSNWWQEKLIFLLGKKISNFGQSWFLPFLWLIITNLSFFTYVHFNFNMKNASLALIIMILFWTSGRLLYEISQKKKVSFYITQHLFTIFALITIIWYFNLGSIREIAEFISIKSPEKNSLNNHYLHIWYLNKAISGFILYYFVIALRRQTRR